VCCAEDGRVYVAGKSGLLIAGRDKRWDVISHGKTDEDIWGLEWFGGKLYASTTNLVYFLSKGKLREVKYGEADIPGSCYHLSAADGILCPSARMMSCNSTARPGRASCDGARRRGALERAKLIRSHRSERAGNREGRYGTIWSITRSRCVAPHPAPSPQSVPVSEAVP
jgi:hypothetical protein